MSELVTLIVPSGGESAPISHGTQEFAAYQAAHLGRGERWLVDVPQEAAQALLRNGGFKMVEGPAPAAPEGKVALVAPNADSAASYEDAGAGAVWVPAAAAGVLVESHGFRVPGEIAAPAAGGDDDTTAPLQAKLVELDRELAAARADVADRDAQLGELVKQNQARAEAVEERDARIAELEGQLAEASAAAADKAKGKA